MPSPHQITALEDRIRRTVRRMTLEEKVDRLQLKGWLQPLSRLGIPAMGLTDGPFGIRDGVQYGTVPTGEDSRATAFPVGVNLAATWNPALLQQVGAAIAREALAFGAAGVWGPAFNMLRSPECGRNFEYMGEDPLLAGRLACAYIRGVQGAGVIATAKHFACNNQEYQRYTINANVSERALREIYWPAFEMTVKEAGVWSVMGAYNKLNGTWCCENPRLLQQLLKEEWGFRGFVISDFIGVHSTDATYEAGLDLEMPPEFFTRDKLLEKIRTGALSTELLDDKITRMLRALFSLGADRRSDHRWHPARRAVLLKQHTPLALAAARESLVLLQNTGALLPLNLKKLRTLTVLGHNAEVLRYGGGGSSAVKAGPTTSPLQALLEKLPGVDVRFAPGWFLTTHDDALPAAQLRTPDGETKGVTGEYFTNADCAGTPLVTRTDPAPSFYWENAGPVAGIADRAEFSVRWTGSFTPSMSGHWRLGAWTGANEQSGMKVWVDDQLLIESWSADLDRECYRHAVIPLTEGQPSRLRIEYRKKAGTPYTWVRLTGRNLGDLATADPRRQALRLARESDAVIILAGSSATFEFECYDRPNIDLPLDQAEQIRAVAKVNPNTIVILNAGAPVHVAGWCEKVKAILWVGFPGQEGGTAIAEALLGEINPTGKLPYTLARHRADWPDTANRPGQDPVHTNYEEGIFIGYRHFDRVPEKVVFPFGHGLSYTRFAYSGLKLTPTSATFTIKNTGRRAGAEVAQVYVEDVAASVPRPPKELKAFTKVFLRPGQSRTVRLPLNDRAFAFWDESAGAWRIEPGEFRIHVGASAQDLRLTGKIRHA